ncbi:MAG: copper chaperone CopZ [Chitinophagales bacterium]
MAGERTEVLGVEGMSCMHCVKTVKNSLASLDGVSNVDVDLESKKVTVAFDPEKTTITEIKDRIEDAGYEVK